MRTESIQSLLASFVAERKLHWNVRDHFGNLCKVNFDRMRTITTAGEANCLPLISLRQSFRLLDAVRLFQGKQYHGFHKNRRSLFLPIFIQKTEIREKSSDRPADSKAIGP